jgi:endonuclease/exonuclease/phosphatase family metal-dependent hydrolase
VKIVSLNAWGGAVFGAMSEWIPQVNCDVLCLQEVTRTPGLTGWTSFEDGERSLPQRADLFRDVRQLLPRHQAWFVTSDSGPVLDASRQTHQQDFGLAVFIREHIPVIAQATKYVHGSFMDHHEWTISDRPRIAQGLRLVDRTANRNVTIVHAHGLRDPAGKHDTPARRAQADALASLVESIREPDDFAILCDDLNLLPDSETFDILAAIGLTDLVGEADTRTSLYKKPLRHANYCLVSNPADVTRFEAPATPEVSDHRPLVVEI